MIFDNLPLNMVILHSYIKQPEGVYIYRYNILYLTYM